MSLIIRRRERTEQPPFLVGASQFIPRPAEIWLPGISSAGGEKGSMPSTEATATSRPVPGGVGLNVTATGRRYSGTWSSGASAVGWLVIAYRDGTATNLYDVIRQDGALSLLQEAIGKPRTPIWISGSVQVPGYSADNTISLYQNRTTVFGGRWDTASGGIMLCDAPGTTEQSLSSGTALGTTSNPMCFGAGETGANAATAWTILGAVLWVGEVPSAALIRQLVRTPWLAWEPQTIRIPQGIAASGSSPYTLTAAAGSYTLTGGAATLKVGRVVTAAAGSYTLTGGAATLAVGHKLTAAAGSFALTGNAATLTRGYRVASSQGGVVVYVNNNLFSASEAFNSSPWNRLNGAVTDDATASPTGSLNADKFAASGTAIPYLEQPFSISAGTTYTVSAYIKANEITSALFVLYGTHWNNGGSNLSATFNLSTGAVTSSTVSSSGATNAGGGWWRCWVTHTATANLSTAGLQLARFSGASTTTGHSLYVWGAQANVGALTDYVQTGQQANLRYSRVLDAVAGSFSLYVAQATLRYSGAPEVETPLAPAGKSKRKDKRRRVEIDGHIYDVPERDLPTLLEAVLTRRKPPKTAIVEPVEREDEDEEGEAEEGVLHETLEAAWEAPSLDEVQARYDAIYAQISAQATADVANMLRRVTERLMAEIEDEEDAIMALVA